MLDIVSILTVLLVLALLTILGLTLALKYVVVNLYLPERREHRLVVLNRDSWRTATERAILMATVYKGLADRATVLAIEPVEARPVETPP